MEKINILDLTLPELEAFLASLGEPAFRARQVWQWLWQKGAREFAAMSSVSKPLRARLDEAARIVWPETADVRESSDGTVKFLLRLTGGALIETVLIPEDGHYTQCLSTQSGCAMACAFCSTGRMGLDRNLTMAEILGQVLMARAFLASKGEPGAASTPDLQPLRNLVFMGMGEPLQNCGNLMRALETLTHPLGLDFSSRRVTVSTVGLRAGLETLGASGLASLAVSLHAPTQELRARIMPKAATATPLPELMACLDRYPLKPRQRITYEYILLRDVNDSLSEARELVRLLGQRKAKVNLIAYNPAPELPFDAPKADKVLAFERYLWDHGLQVTLRKSKGQDICAACGQLRAARERQADSV